VLALLLAAGGVLGQDARVEVAPSVPPATPGAPTVELEDAMRVALERNFSLLNSGDSVAAARWQESAAAGQFLPQVVPTFEQGEGRTGFGLDVSQRIPWTGGTLVASGRYLSQPDVDAPYPRTSDLRLILSQPLLRDAGPNATYFELTNSRRLVEGQERSLVLARQRLMVQVAAAFYAVIAQRQLFEVADQSLQRTESLLQASDARLKVGMASKLDVFRAELQAAQAREGMIRARASLETALEQFRGILALPPDNPLEPAAVSLSQPAEEREDPLEVLVQRALDNRLELKEARDRVHDAERAASLARQNMLPRLDVNLGVTQLGFGRSFGEAWSVADRQVEFFLSASYPVRQSTQKANRAVSELEVQSRKRDVDQLELQVKREVHQAVRELDRIRQSVDVQEQAVDVAVKQRRLAVLRYQRGLASNFDVVDAESNLVVARSALVSLLTSFAVARLELLRVIGTLSIEAGARP